MLHRVPVGLERPVEYVSNEEIFDRMPIWQETSGFRVVAPFRPLNASRVALLKTRQSVR